MDSLSKRKIYILILTIIFYNVIILIFSLSSQVIEYCILAYTLGLRHALDADHIAAIDNATRKLVNEKKLPIFTGTFFALGHSTIVLLLTIIVSLSTREIINVVPQLADIGSIIGTFISATILYIIGITNLFIFIDIYRKYISNKIEDNIGTYGFMSRILKALFNVINKESDMYLIGLLFGLGFNTATEVALLGLSAIISLQQNSILEVLLLPLSFTAGMVLVDSLDGVFMTTAYSWAFIDARRKAYYNLTITSLSAIIALFIGSIEFLQVVSQEFSLNGSIWSIVNSISFENLGIIVVFLFGIGWGISLLIYKYKFKK